MYCIYIEMPDIHGLNEYKKSSRGSSRSSNNKSRSSTTTLTLKPKPQEETATESDRLIKKSVHTNFKKDAISAVKMWKDKYDKKAKEAFVAHKVLNDKETFESDLIRQNEELRQQLEAERKENERLLRQRVDEDDDEPLEVLLQLREEQEPDLGDTETAEMYERMTKKYMTHRRK